MATVFIPLIIDTRDCLETDPEVFTCGVFTQKGDAVNALLNGLIDKEYIQYENYLCHVRWKQIKCIEEIVDKKTFRKYLTRNVNGNFDNLECVCAKFGDSWYQDRDGWSIRIYKHDNMSNQKVYVPTITDVRDPYFTDTIVCGAFSRKNDAVNALLNKLIDKGLITYEEYKEGELYGDKEDKLHIEEIVDEKSFRIWFAHEIDGDLDKLENLLDKLAGSHFSGGLKIRLDYFTLQ